MGLARARMVAGLKRRPVVALHPVDDCICSGVLCLGQRQQDRNDEEQHDLKHASLQR